MQHTAARTGAHKLSGHTGISAGVGASPPHGAYGALDQGVYALLQSFKRSAEISGFLHPRMCICLLYKQSDVTQAATVMLHTQIEWAL